MQIKWAICLGFTQPIVCHRNLSNLVYELGLLAQEFEIASAHEIRGK
jgi:hypothetical protein